MVSSTVSVCTEPMPWRTPPAERDPEKMIRKLVPSAPIWLWIADVAPWPIATIATTQPTPMMTPSIVSSVRIGLRRSATSETL